MGLFPLLAAVVSGAFAVSVLVQFRKRRRLHQLAWGVALVTFSLASLFAAAGMFTGWSDGIFRAYYFFGAMVNVPILALGTVYLYFSRPVGHAAALAVAGLTVYGVAAVLGAELNQAGLAVTAAIPRGSEVMAPSVRALSRYYSYGGFLIVVSGAVWAAARFARRPGERFKRLAQGNALIAAGTTVLALGSAFARQGRGSVFAVGLAAGATIMYAGFLRTSAPTPGRSAAEPSGQRVAGEARPGVSGSGGG